MKRRVTQTIAVVACCYHDHCVLDYMAISG